MSLPKSVKEKPLVLLTLLAALLLIVTVGAVYSGKHLNTTNRDKGNPLNGEELTEEIFQIPPLDTIPPTCSLDSANIGLPKSVKFTIQDGEGLDFIKIVMRNNAIVSTPKNMLMSDSTESNMRIGTRFVYEIGRAHV